MWRVLGVYIGMDDLKNWIYATLLAAVLALISIMRGGEQ